MKNFNVSIRSRTYKLLACSAVPKRTVPPRPPPLTYRPQFCSAVDDITPGVGYKINFPAFQYLSESIPRIFEPCTADHYT